MAGAMPIVQPMAGDRDQGAVARARSALHPPLFVRARFVGQTGPAKPALPSYFCSLGEPQVCGARDCPFKQIIVPATNTTNVLKRESD